MGISRPGLKRSRDQRMIAGVCGGIAEWLGWSATSVRIAFFLVSVLSAAFPGDRRVLDAVDRDAGARPREL